MQRKGIIAAGNWITDIVKILDIFPAQESLANILSESVSNGGSPYNVLKDLSKLQAPFPLEAIGLVGNDERGKVIIADCKAHQIATEKLQTTHQAPTSYTDVMSVASDGKRTFFHQRGANAMLDTEHIDLTTSSAKIFHLGYLMLLDKLDAVENNSTKAAQVFKQAQALGFITSTDMVSENSNRFKEVVAPSLPYIDVLFINEFEAEKITHIATTTDGKIDIENCKKACSALLALGVKHWVILHFPQGAIATNVTGKFAKQGSLNLPNDYIVSAVGAGDAFAAGVLYGLHEDWAIEKCLKLGVCAAAASLTKANCSNGILPQEECLLLESQFGCKNI
jgi:sugar/nucleoside kinase (ribokinase family)